MILLRKYFVFLSTGNVLVLMMMILYLQDVSELVQSDRPLAVVRLMQYWFNLSLLFMKNGFCVFSRFFKKSRVRVFFLNLNMMLFTKGIIQSLFTYYLCSLFLFCIVLFSVGSVNMPYLCLCVFIV